MSAASVRAPRLRAVGLHSGWGRGLGAVPESARVAASGRAVIRSQPLALSGDRFRRATRECLLAVAAVEDALEEARLPRAVLSGAGTALLYATASAYGSSNRAFIEGTGVSTLHFPYTAPSAVPAEVAIEFGITGAYLIFLGGAPATLSALWYAATLLASSECARALVLAVETFEECADLYAQGRWLVPRPLVETAACALLEPGEGELSYAEHRPTHAARRDLPLRERFGEAFSCLPLVELGLASAEGRDLSLTGTWRGSQASLRWLETPSQSGQV